MQLLKPIIALKNVSLVFTVRFFQQFLRQLTGKKQKSSGSYKKPLVQPRLWWISSLAVCMNSK